MRTALAADVPEEFKNDLQERYVEQWEVVKPELGAPGAKMFDVFRIWRLDSGRYTDIVSVISWSFFFLFCISAAYKSIHHHLF